MSFFWFHAKELVAEDTSVRRTMKNFACKSLDRLFLNPHSILPTVLCVRPAAAVQPPGDPKRLACRVERNARSIGMAGDLLYYFGEPGMQAFERSKDLKPTLEQIGFKIELGGAGLPTNVWPTWGSGKPMIALVTV